MSSESLKELERNISRAIEAIAGLRDENNKLEKENESLRRRIEECRNAAEEYKKALSAAAAKQRSNQPDMNIRAVKARLEKLVVKLAALEDSWN